MKKYLQYRCWDLIFCIVISVGLAVNLLSGFEIDDVTERMPVLVVLVVVVCAVCLLAAINRMTALIGIAAGVAALIIAVVLYRGTNIFINDAENASQIFYIVVIAAAVAVFLVCRSRAGIVILFLLGNILQAGAAFLQFPTRTWAYLLFLIGCGLMMFYRVYVRSILKAHTGKVRFRGYMTQNLCVCLAALLAATGIFAGIIRPLNPPTDDLKLIQQLMSFEILEKIGVSTVLVQVDRDKISVQEPEEEMATDEREEQEEEEDAGIEEEPDREEQDDAGNQQDTAAAFTERARAISYQLAKHWYILVILAAVLVCLGIYSRKLLRKKWLAEIDRLPRGDAVLNLFALFVFGMERAGCKKAANLTLDEYRKVNAKQLRKFDAETVDFTRLTEIYRKAYYGRQSVTDEEYADYLSYYAAFHRNVRKAVGIFRYVILYFRL
ncbi:MAG: DUF4129 domain-containing protein [Lachnospiraceae bacterium]|nr:DUF4129 domain-containing protein [Lachnospiraceae bacterium]